MLIRLIRGSFRETSSRAPSPAGNGGEGPAGATAGGQRGSYRPRSSSGAPCVKGRRRAGGARSASIRDSRTSHHPTRIISIAGSCRCGRGRAGAFLHHDRLEVPEHGVLGGRGHALVGQHPDDEDRLGLQGTQDPFEVAVEEGAQAGLVDVPVAPLRARARRRFRSPTCPAADRPPGGTDEGGRTVPRPRRRACRAGSTRPARSSSGRPREAAGWARPRGACARCRCPGSRTSRPGAESRSGGRWRRGTVRPGTRSQRASSKGVT